MVRKSEMTWILPPAAWALPDIKELWQYRSLILQLAIKDFRVRYMQTWLGALWSVVNPLISALLLNFVFHKVARTNTSLALNSYVFVMSGMVVWTFFSTLVPEAMQGMMNAQAMIKKIYFPKLVIPLSKMLGALVETLVSLLLFLIVCCWYQQWPQWSAWLLLPLYLIAMMILGVGLSLWATVLTLISKDFMHVIPHIIRLGMLICPIAYPVFLVPEKFQWLYFLNPVSGFMEGFRSLLFEGYELHSLAWISWLSALLLVVSGFIAFRKFEFTIADIL